MCDRVTEEDVSREGAMTMGEAPPPPEQLPKPESALRLRAAIHEVENRGELLDECNLISDIPKRAKDFCNAWEEFEAARIQCKAEAGIEARRVIVG